MPKTCELNSREEFAAPSYLLEAKVEVMSKPFVERGPECSWQEVLNALSNSRAYADSMKPDKATERAETLMLGMSVKTKQRCQEPPVPTLAKTADRKKELEEGPIKTKSIFLAGKHKSCHSLVLSAGGQAPEVLEGTGLQSSMKA
eukprot:scaffold70515_cov16-Tisochrysis_lutea.AAC.2